MELYKKLKQYQETDAYPFHMPGHKRNRELMREIYGGEPCSPFDVDITEIDGFDDLHHAEGILRDAMEFMAWSVGAKESRFVVNGSSGGILAAIYAACRPGSGLAAARNCHRSVAHGMQLCQLVPYYIYPQDDPILGISMGITMEMVEDILEKHGDISAILVTSPTYEGIVSDIRGIAEAAHRHHALLIVDEAHGAHLPFGKESGLPESAVTQGADLVIQSIHKTLPALTQSAALHICSDRVDISRVDQGLRMFETSSPSYVMMAGMDACMRYMASKGSKRLKRVNEEVDEIYRRVSRMEELRLLTPETVTAAGPFSFDRMKLVLSAAHLPHFGGELHRMLSQRWHLQPEMSTPEYVILMTTVGDQSSGLKRLADALDEINRELAVLRKCRDSEAYDIRKPQETEISGSLFVLPEAEVVVRPDLAAEGETETIDVRCAAGRVSAEMAYIYPPGIPFLMPGERIRKEHVQLIRYYREFNRELHGMNDETGETLKVLVR